MILGCIPSRPADLCETRICGPLDGLSQLGLRALWSPGVRGDRNFIGLVSASQPTLVRGAGYGLSNQHKTVDWLAGARRLLGHHGGLLSQLCV
jgi:hypothetical protein